MVEMGGKTEGNVYFEIHAALLVMAVALAAVEPNLSTGLAHESR
jgi:hypothetical protein